MVLSKCVIRIVSWSYSLMWSWTLRAATVTKALETAMLSLPVAPSSHRNFPQAVPRGIECARSDHQRLPLLHTMDISPSETVSVLTLLQHMVLNYKVWSVYNGRMKTGSGMRSHVQTSLDMNICCEKWLGSVSWCSLEFLRGVMKAQKHLSYCLHAYSTMRRRLWNWFKQMVLCQTQETK